jgi:hypothetical protein
MVSYPGIGLQETEGGSPATWVAEGPIFRLLGRPPPAQAAIRRSAEKG